MDIKASIKGIVNALYPERGNLPRRNPGTVEVAGRPFHYVDLHSLFYQFLQIVLRDLYGFTTTKPNPYIIDAGAHVGVASLYLTQAYPHATVDAFEADAPIAEALARNMAAFAPNVRVHHKAVWVHGDGISFNASCDDSGHVDEASDVVGATVPSVRLRDLIVAAEDGVDLLKLDVEGAEFTILNDCRDVLDRVSHMVIEVHQLTENGPGVGPLLTTLEDAGFHYTITGAELATWVEGTASPFLACPTDRYIFTVYCWRRTLQ